MSEKISLPITLIREQFVKNKEGHEQLHGFEKLMDTFLDVVPESESHHITLDYVRTFFNSLGIRLMITDTQLKELSRLSIEYKLKQKENENKQRQIVN